MNENVLNRKVITCIISLHNKVEQLICNLYLDLRIGMEEKYFWGTSASDPMLPKQFQNKSEFEIEHKERYLFSSKIEGSIPTFRDTYIY